MGSNLVQSVQLSIISAMKDCSIVLVEEERKLVFFLHLLTSYFVFCNSVASFFLSQRSTIAETFPSLNVSQ